MGIGNIISQDLKYTISLCIFLQKKVEHILQEIYARLIMYNFSELITSHVIIERKTENMNTKPTFLLQHTYVRISCRYKYST